MERTKKKWEVLHNLSTYENENPDLLEVCKEIAESIRHIKGQLPEQMKKPYQRLLKAIANS